MYFTNTSFKHFNFYLTRTNILKNTNCCLIICGVEQRPCLVIMSFHLKAFENPWTSFEKNWIQSYFERAKLHWPVSCDSLQDAVVCLRFIIDGSVPSATFSYSYFFCNLVFWFGLFQVFYLFTSIGKYECSCCLEEDTLLKCFAFN